MSCKFIIYEKGNEQDKIEFEEFEFPFQMRIYDIRSEIMWRLYVGDRQIQNEKYYLEMVNIGSKVYKDFGKQFFDLGLQPKTIDNSPLSKFTAEERTFEFMVYRVEKKDLTDYIPVKELTVKEHQELHDIMRRIEDKKYEKMNEEYKKKKEEESKIVNNYSQNYNSNNYTNNYSNPYSNIYKNNKTTDEW